MQLVQVAAHIRSMHLAAGMLTDQHIGDQSFVEDIEGALKRAEEVLDRRQKRQSSGADGSPARVRRQHGIHQCGLSPAGRTPIEDSAAVGG